MGLYSGRRNNLYAGRGGIYTGRRGHGGFSPLQNPGMKLWYDASDSSTVTPDMTRASDISNKIDGTATLSQATDANQPDYPRTINGLNALDFGGSDYMENVSADVDIGSSQMMFFVAQSDVVADDIITGNFVAGGTPWFQVHFRSNGDMWFRMHDGTNTTNGITAVGYSASETLVCVFGWNATTHFIRVNGTDYSVASTITPALSTARWVIGSGTVGAGVAGLDGALCEQYLCDYLDAAGVSQNETYLANKWGATLA